MKIQSVAATWILATMIGSVSFSQNPPATQLAVRVLSSNGVKAVIEELQPQAERAIGRPLSIEFSTAATLRQRIEGGEAFDVALLTKESVDDLVGRGKIARATRVGLARSGVGVGFRKGAPRPDVSTSSAMRQTLLRSESVAYTKDGASRTAIDAMLDRLGIAQDMQLKILLESAGQAPLRVADGKAELVLTLISEILPVPGIELAGPLPKEFQSYIAFDAGLSASSKNTDAGKALIQFLTTPLAAQVFKAKGMETGK